MRRNRWLKILFLPFILSSCQPAADQERSTSGSTESATRSVEPRNLELQRNVADFQRALIADGLAAGSVAGVFSGRETLAYSVVQSGLEGDTPISPETIFPIWSMTKPITTVAMMILRERGLYEVNDPVSKYIPYFANLRCKAEDGPVYSCRNELLIEHLLSHRSGYRYYDEGSGPDLTAYDNLDDFVKDHAALPVEFEPGTDYRYGINQAILGRVVEVLSGMEFYEFLKETIFDPLGMADTKFYLTPADREHFQILFKRPDAAESDSSQIVPVFSTTDDELSYAPGTKAQFGGEGLVSTFEDYRRFCEMLLGRGAYQGTRILSEESIDLMTTVRTEFEQTEGPTAGMDHAYGLFVLTKPELDESGSSRGIFGWVGVQNTYFWIDYEKNIYALFMTRTSPLSWEMHNRFRTAVYGTPI